MEQPEALLHCFLDLGEAMLAAVDRWQRAALAELG